MKDKEPSLLRKLIEIHHEQALRRKALRNLNKLEWSVEFLEYLVEHAAKIVNSDVELVLESAAGQKLHIKSAARVQADKMADDDIFNHLDDQAAVTDFIWRHSKR